MDLGQEGDATSYKRLDSYVNYLRNGEIIFQMRESVLKVFDETGKEIGQMDPLYTLICYVGASKIAEIDIGDGVAWKVQADFPVSVSSAGGRKVPRIIWIAAPSKSYAEYIEVRDRAVTFPAEDDPSIKDRYLSSIARTMSDW